jgi:hypothetical protein
MNPIPWAVLSVIAFAAILVFAALGTMMVFRLVRRPALPLSSEVGSIPTVLRKLRNREPMTEEELTLARQAIADRGSPLALCIPATLFSLGCFFVFGSLEQLHGKTPSERTFLGVFPMLTAANLAIQLLRSASLKRRLPRRPHST